METLERLILIVSHARRIPKEQPEQDERARGTLGQRHQHLVERQVVQEVKAHAVGEWLERTAKLDSPVPFERRSTEDDLDVGCVRRELEDVLDQAGQLKVVPDERGILRDRI